jgi:hypothetical protein
VDIVLAFCHHNKILIESVYKEKGLFWLRVSDFIPWAFGSIAFGCVVRQNIRVRCMAEEAAHLMVARKRRETGRA